MNNRLFIGVVYVLCFIFSSTLVLSAEGDYTGFNFATSPCNEPTGLTSNGNYIWVGDYTADAVCKYHMNGTYINQFSMTTGNNNPYDIYTDSNYIWVIDLTDSDIYKYHMNGTYIKKFLLTGSPNSLFLQGDYFYVSDDGDNNLYKYHENNFTSLGSQFSIPDAPYGIESDGTHIWIASPVNEASDTLYKYWFNGTDTGLSWSLASQITTSYGMGMNDSMFFILDYSNDRVYGYEREVASSPSTLINVSLTSDNSTSTYPTNNDSVLHSTYFQSNVSLSSYIFSWNASGSYVNDSAVSMSGTSAWANISKFVHYPKNTIISWLIYGNNTESVWASTSVFTYIVKNSIPSLVLSPVFNDTSLTVNESVRLNLTLSDEDGLNDINSVISRLNIPYSQNFITGNSSPLNYSYSTSNPIINTSLGIPLEVSAIYEDGVIHYWYNRYIDPSRYMKYANSTDGINIENEYNLTSPTEPTWGALSYVIKVNSTYYMFAPNISAPESSANLYVYNSTDRINWDLACASAITNTGYQKNPATYYDSETGIWHGLFERGSGNFNIYYWNSTSLCSGWTEYTNPFGDNGGNADIHYRNGEFIVYFGDMSVSPSNMNISVWRGNRLDDLSIMGKFVVGYNENVWENNMATDPEILIIPDNDSTYPYKYYAYYSGANTGYGLAYDSANRTFDEAHFIKVLGTSQNLTLTQVGSTSEWELIFSATNTTGFYNLTDLWISDGDDTLYTDFNDSLTYFEIVEAGDSTPPSVAFDSQTPPDVNSSNAISSSVNISYIISDANLNTSTIKLYYKINGTTINYIDIINGTAVSGFQPLDYFSNVTSNFTFKLDDHEVYPTIYNLDPEYVESANNLNITLLNNNYFVKTSLTNISNDTTYNWFEVSVRNISANPDPLLAYYCNSTYVSGKVQESNSCTQFGSLDSVSANLFHTHEGGQGDYTLSLSITNGLIGGVKVTPTSYFLVGGSSDWNVQYVSNITTTTTTQETSNNGILWTNVVGTGIAYIHQFDNDTSFWYYVCANDTSNNQNCTGVKQDLLELGGLAPSSPNILTPLNKSYSGNVNITFTASQSPNEYPISYYNITLLNTDFTYNNTIIDNTSSLFNYTTISVDGSYIIKVTAYDSQSLSANGFSEVFSIDTTSPSIILHSPTNTTYTSNPVSLQVTSNENIAYAWYSLNGGTNTTFTPNSTITAVNGNNNITVFINDSAGNENSSGYVYFTYTPAGGGGGGGGGGGSTTSPSSNITLSKIEIVDEDICSNLTYIYFSALNPEGNPSNIDSAELFVDGISKTKQYYYSITKKKYYFNIGSLEVGSHKFQVVATQSVKSASDSKTLTVSDCSDVASYISDKVDKGVGFFSENKGIIGYTAGALIVLVLGALFLSEVRNRRNSRKLTNLP